MSGELVVVEKDNALILISPGKQVLLRVPIYVIFFSLWYYLCFYIYSTSGATFDDIFSSIQSYWVLKIMLFIPLLTLRPISSKDKKIVFDLADNSVQENGNHVDSIENIRSIVYKKHRLKAVPYFTAIVHFHKGKYLELSSADDEKQIKDLVFKIAWKTDKPMQSI